MKKDEFWKILQHYNHNYFMNEEVRKELDSHLNYDCEFFFLPSLNETQTNRIIYFRDSYLLYFQFDIIKYQTTYIPLKNINYLIKISGNSLQINYCNENIIVEVPKILPSKYINELKDLFKNILYEIAKINKHG